MKAQPVSCIIPVFNGERYLREALDSILAQTHRPFDIIVVDDGSTDGTPAVVAGYGVQVRYVRQPNTGPAAARNLGVRSGGGEFIAFLDADDLWHPEKLARQMTRFREQPDLDLCITHVEHFSDLEPSTEELFARDPRLRSLAFSGIMTQTGAEVASIR